MTQKISSVNIETATLASFSGPTIANVSIANSTYVLLDDTAVSNAGGYVVITGSNFQSGAQVLFGSTSACTVTFVDSTRLNVQVPALTAGSYVVYVQNGDGSTAVRLNGITSSPIPVWATNSTLTTQVANTPISISLSATSDSSVIYSVANGSSLPSGTTLASNGLFSGTVTTGTETTYNFSVNAIDSENQETLRSFSVTVSIGDPYYYLTTLHIPAESVNNSNNIIFLDSSTNNLSITRNGNTSQGTFTPFSQSGWSVYFDGTGDYLDAPSNSAFTLSTGDFTIEGWMHISSGTSGTLYDSRTSLSSVSPVIYLNSGVLTYFATTNRITGPTLLKDQWYHIAVSRVSGNTKMFVNGNQVGTTYADTNDYVIGAPKIGAGWNNGNLLNGYISNLRVIKGTALYTANTSPPTTPLSVVSNTSLLMCNSNGFRDDSNNKFNITRTGDTMVRAFSPFATTSSYTTSIVGGSAYFNGSVDYLNLASTSAISLDTGDFTWETWIYLDTSTIPSFTDIYDQRNGTNGAAVIQPVVELTTTNGYAWYVAAANRITSGSAAVKLRSWQHLAVCRSSGVTKMFLDGVQVGASYTDTNNYPAGSLYIGRANDGVSTRYLTGYLSNLRVVKGTALYTANTTPPTAPLSAVSNTALLLNFTNAGITDATGKNVIETGNQSKISNTQSKFGNTSIYFDGTDDYISTPYSPLFNLGAGPFTIECWVNFDVLSGNRMIFDTYTAASAGGGYQLYWRGTGTSITFYGNGVIIAQSTYTSHVTGTWYHVAVTRDSVNSVRIFVDGTQYANATYSSALDIATTSSPTLGSQKLTLTNDLAGYVDEFRITKGYARYTANFTPPTAAFPKQ